MLDPVFPVPALIDSNIGSAGIGGIILGLGIGLGLRYGVVLDTLQMPKMPQQMSHLLTRLKLPYVHIMVNTFRTVIGRTLCSAGNERCTLQSHA